MSRKLYLLVFFVTVISISFWNIMNENVALSLISSRGKKLCRLMSAMWFDSNALEMTTAEHFMYLTKFCELHVC